MILVGSQRAGAKALAQHLLKEENDHVEVHELRGFSSDDLTGALREAQAVSRGTRCKQYLFSLSFNPPPDQQVATGVFEDAIARAEKKLGLDDQPRAIVFHEKEGRRHCHVVWSRIDADEMKAVPLPFTHQKLQELSRELYLEHGWKMPRGLTKSEERDPRNFTLAEWQQAKRTAQDPREIKSALQDCWAISDSRQALNAALESRGFLLAQGDRRAVVVVDIHGEVYALARWAAVKSKDVRERVGETSDLPSVAQRQEEMAGKVGERLRELRAQSEESFSGSRAREEKAKALLLKQQREARGQLEEMHAARRDTETIERASRFRTGLLGLWDRLTGRHQRMTETCEAETFAAFRRDRTEKDGLIFSHLEARRAIHERMAGLQELHRSVQDQLWQDIEAVSARSPDGRRAMLEEFRQRANSEHIDSAADGTHDSERHEALRRLREERSMPQDTEREIK